MATRFRWLRGPAGGWSLWSGVLAVGAALLAVLVVVSVGLFDTSTRLRAAQRHQTVNLDAAQNDAAVLLGNFLDEETGLRGYLVGAQALFLAPYRQAAAAIPATEAALRSELQTDGPAMAALQTSEAAFGSWQDRYASPTLTAVGRGDLGGAQAVSAMAQGKILFDQLRARMTALRGVIRSGQESNEATIGGLQARLEALLIVALASLAGSVVGVTAVTRRTVIRPLDALTAASRQVADGDRYAPVPIRGPWELRSLGADMTAMRDRLLEEINRARLAGEALHHDVPTVSALSDALVPRHDHLPGIVTVGRLDPAEGILAGDWYDVLVLGTTLALVVGDVSGHGPHAAVRALGLRSVITTVLRAGGKPGEAIAAAAAHIADGRPEHFATAFVAVLDPAAGEVAYANAGHPAALLHSAGQQADADELSPTGPLISPVVALWSWTTRIVPFRPGDGVLIFTDGVTEGRNARKEQYGIGRLKQALAGAGHHDPIDVVEVIAADLTVFVGGSQADDRTLVYCRRLTLAEALAE